MIWRDIPGTVSWKRGLDQARYNVHLYRVTEGPGEDEEVACWTDWHSATNADAYLSSPAFLNGDAEHIDFESGTYYFTVQALGDGINYDDGAVATSETWTYTKPETKLPVLTGTAWKNGDMVWAAPADLAGYYGYETNVYFAAADEDTPELIGGTTALDFDTVDYLDDYLIESYGEGCYWFRVRAISFDITKRCNSDWSELCGPYRLGDVSEEVKSNLNGVLEELGDEPTTAADVAQAIKAQLADSNMSVQDLANAMSADDGAEGGTLELIAELEKRWG